jgi:hypothetical protein
MPSFDTTSFAAVLRTDWYKNYIISQLNEAQPIVKMFTEDPEAFETGGTSLEASLKRGRNNAVMSTVDGGLLATPKPAKYIRLSIPKRYTYGSVQWTGPVIRQSMKSEATFGNALDEGAEDLVESMDRFRSRVLCGFGRGILCLVNGAGSGTATINVDAPGGVAGAVNGNRFLNEDLDVCIVDPTTGTVLAFRTVSSISANGLSVTFNSTVSAAEAPDNAFLVIGATDGTNIQSSLDLEAMGLLGMIDDGTFVANYFNQSRTSFPILKSFVLSSAGVLSALKLQRGMDAAARKNSGKYPDCHVMDHSVRREYLDLRSSQFFYINDKMNPDVGYDKGAMDGEIEYTKTAIYPIADFAYGTWLAFRKDTMVRAIDGEGEWINEHGAILDKIPNRDIFIANYRLFENFWCKRPNTGFRLDGVTATVDVDHLE